MLVPFGDSNSKSSYLLLPQVGRKASQFSHKIFDSTVFYILSFTLFDFSFLNSKNMFRDRDSNVCVCFAQIEVPLKPTLPRLVGYYYLSRAKFLHFCISRGGQVSVPA